jgi:hypothetical protein
MTKAVDSKVKQQEVAIPAMNLQHMDVALVGDSPLVVHAWSEKARRQLLGKQMGEAKQAKEKKVPEADFMDSLYWLTKKPKSPTMEDLAKGEFGFPAVAFKAAAVDACSHVDGTTKVQARGAFHIDGELVRIEGMPTMREDMVRLASGVADVRFRGEFRVWRVRLPIRYNANVLSMAQIVNLFNVAGFAIGVGEHRPQKNGSWGMFHVARQGE